MNTSAEPYKEGSRSHQNDSTFGNESFTTYDYLSDHPIGQILQKHLGNVERILSIHAEADLSPELKGKILSACADLNTFIAGVDPTLEQVAPTLWGQRSRSLSLDVTLALGIFPEHIVDNIRAFIEESTKMQPVQFQFLQTASLDTYYPSATLQKDSALEWYAMSCDTSYYPHHTCDPRTFIESLVGMLKLRKDCVTRHDIAKSWVEQQKNRMVVLKELGHDVPVLFEQGSFRLDCQVAFSNPIAQHFGHQIQVLYVEGSKYWLIVTLGIPHSKVLGKLSNTTISINDMGGFATGYTTLGQVQNAIEQIRASGIVEFKKVRSDDQYSDYRPNVYYGRGKAHEFYGVRSVHPIILKSIKQGTITRLHGEATADRPDHIIRLTFTTDNALKIVVPVSLNGRDFKKEKDNLFAEIDRGRVVVKLLEFADGSSLVLLKKPLTKLVSKTLLIEPEAVPAKHKTFNICGFQSFNIAGEYFPILDYPEIHKAHKRFNQNKIRLDYDSVDSLDLNRPINRHKMQYGFDPMLAKIGFRTNESGHNGLMDYWDLSIPLHKPTIEQFDTTELASISALKVIPAHHWRIFLKSIEGDWVENLEEVLYLDYCPSRNPKYSGVDDIIGAAIQIPDGEYYKAPRISVDIFGTWMVSKCEIAGQKYYIVDSPFYGNALYLFRYRDGANEAAKHFQAHGQRQAARNFPGYIRKIIHSQNWKSILTDEIYSSIVGKPRAENQPDLG